MRRCKTHGYHVEVTCSACDSVADADLDEVNADADLDEGNADELTWADYSLAELRGQAKDWGLSGYSSLRKPELIELLEAAEFDDAAADLDEGDAGDV